MDHKDTGAFGLKWLFDILDNSNLRRMNFVEGKWGELYGGID